MNPATGEVEDGHYAAAPVCRALAMVGLSTDAFSAPPVLLSTVRANSAGQSFDLRSCERRPFETFNSIASCVRDIAPSRLRYASSVCMFWV